jgi:hypothetical protein
VRWANYQVPPLVLLGYVLVMASAKTWTICAAFIVVGSLLYAALNHSTVRGTYGRHTSAQHQHEASGAGSDCRVVGSSSHEQGGATS